MTRVVFADAKCTLLLKMDGLADLLPHIGQLFGIAAVDHSVLLSGSDAGLMVLRAKLEPNSRWLRIMGGSMAVSPRSSTVARRVVTELGLDGCERQLTEVPSDQWRVAAAEMQGQMPDTLFHGTSTRHLSNIRLNGLRLNMPPNWSLGDDGGAHNGTPVISLAAEANVAAIHAYETAEKIGGLPVVIEVAKPWNLLADHDVMRAIGTVAGTGRVAMEASSAVGLFATPDPVPSGAFLTAKTPTLRTTWDSWTVLP